MTKKKGDNTFVTPCIYITMKLFNFVKLVRNNNLGSYKSVLMSKPNIRKKVVSMFNICASIN